MRDLIAAGFPLFAGSAQPLERLVKERFNIVRLQAACIGTLHILPDPLHTAGVHGIVDQHTFFEE